MTVKNNIAKKLWWSKISKEERSKIMSARVKLAWSKRTKVQRQDHVAKMNKARLLKAR